MRSSTRWTAVWRSSSASRRAATAGILAVLAGALAAGCGDSGSSSASGPVDTRLAAPRSATPFDPFDYRIRTGSELMRVVIDPNAPTVDALPVAGAVPADYGMPTDIGNRAVRAAVVVTLETLRRGADRDTALSTLRRAMAIVGKRFRGTTDPAVCRAVGVVVSALLEDVGLDPVRSCRDVIPR